MSEKTSLQTVSHATLRADIPGDSVQPEAGDEFVTSTYVDDLTQRALAYLEVGYPVHFAGPAGTGKTTLAFHVAAQLTKPVVLIHGDDEFAGSDLVGRDSGYRKSSVVDNYIHSVLRTEESMNTIWEDNRLTTACSQGHTLIYDEFTRSRPEANNALLSVLEEKILNLPKLRRAGAGYLQVHPGFRAIFTSNPEEYAGVHKTQDALMDRLITITLGHFDRETEIAVTMRKSAISQRDAEVIVDLVRELRGVGVRNHRPTIRASIAIARIMAYLDIGATLDDPRFASVCQDVLNTDTAKVTRDGHSVMTEKVNEALQNICGKDARVAEKAAISIK